MGRTNAFVSQSVRDTQAIARSVAGKLQGGEVLRLIGELGSGKTTFVTGMLRFYGYRERVLSPSFTLCREYEVKKGTVRHVVHVDLYRLKEESLFSQTFHFFDMIGRPDTVVAIEWPQKIRSMRFAKCVDVRFVATGENTRKISVRYGGSEPETEEKGSRSL